jgi:hypothetical protein
MTKRTIDPKTIRRWAEARNGCPAAIKTPEPVRDPGVLRIDFPGSASGEKVEHISWDAFFRKFVGADLAMIYEEETVRGDPSYFCKFISRSSADPH